METVPRLSYRPFQTCVQSLFWKNSNNFKHEHKFLIIGDKTHYQKKWFALSAFDTNGFCNSEMFHYVTFMISNKNFRKIINKFSPSSCAKSYFLKWGGRARDVNKALWELFCWWTWNSPAPASQKMTGAVSRKLQFFSFWLKIRRKKHNNANPRT